MIARACWLFLNSLLSITALLTLVWCVSFVGFAFTQRKRV